MAMARDDYVTEQFCTERHQADHKQQELILSELMILNNRLYKDNGTISIQTQLVRGSARMEQIERRLAAVWWLAGSVLLAVLVQLVLLKLGK